MSKAHGHVVRIVGYLLGIHEKAINTMPVDGIDDLTAVMQNKLEVVEHIRLLCSIRNFMIRKYRELSVKLRRYKDGGIPPRFLVQLSSLGFSTVTFDNYSDVVNALSQEICDILEANYEELFPVDAFDYLAVFRMSPMTGAKLREISEGDFSVYPFGAYTSLADMRGSSSKFILSTDEDLRGALSATGCLRDASIKSSIKMIEEQLREDFAVYVDCDNSNVVDLLSFVDWLKTTGVWKNCKRCVLFQDETTAAVWNGLLLDNGEIVKTSRVLRDKSGVDMALGVRVTRDICICDYKKVVLFSSDSDYVNVVAANQEARFLVILDRDRITSKYPALLSRHGAVWTYGTMFRQFLNRDEALRVFAKESFVHRILTSPYRFTALNDTGVSECIRHDAEVFGMTEISIDEIHRCLKELTPELRELVTRH